MKRTTFGLEADLFQRGFQLILKLDEHFLPFSQTNPYHPRILGMGEGSHAPNADQKRLPRLDWVLNRLKNRIDLRLLNIPEELEREVDVLSIGPPHIGITCLQVLLELLESLRN